MIALKEEAEWPGEKYNIKLHYGSPRERHTDTAQCQWHAPELVMQFPYFLDFKPCKNAFWEWFAIYIF